jgi:hypothetical protein
MYYRFVLLFIRVNREMKDAKYFYFYDLKKYKSWTSYFY